MENENEIIEEKNYKEYLSKEEKLEQNELDGESSGNKLMDENVYENSLDDESNLRRRIPWSDRISFNSDIPGLHEVKELLDDDDTSCLAEEDDTGCPLPSTPEDDRLMDCEVNI